mmetsp:Transcript_22033/g.62970  ORF Transcript_22033/g.62970 Transcript_22033/m.62970 type:complete len:268 (+) Transcript_22033:420-1223(+)
MANAFFKGLTLSSALTRPALEKPSAERSAARRGVFNVQRAEEVLEELGANLGGGGRGAPSQNREGSRVVIELERPAARAPGAVGQVLGARDDAWVRPPFGRLRAGPVLFLVTGNCTPKQECGHGRGVVNVVGCDETRRGKPLLLGGGIFRARGLRSAQHRWPGCLRDRWKHLHHRPHRVPAGWRRRGHQVHRGPRAQWSGRRRSPIAGFRKGVGLLRPPHRRGWTLGRRLRLRPGRAHTGARRPRGVHVEGKGPMGVACATQLGLRW